MEFQDHLTDRNQVKLPDASRWDLAALYLQRDRLAPRRDRGEISEMQRLVLETSIQTRIDAELEALLSLRKESPADVPSSPSVASADAAAGVDEEDLYPEITIDYSADKLDAKRQNLQQHIAYLDGTERPELEASLVSKRKALEQPGNDVQREQLLLDVAALEERLEQNAQFRAETKQELDAAHVTAFKAGHITEIELTDEDIEEEVVAHESPFKKALRVGRQRSRISREPDFTALSARENGHLTPVPMGLLSQITPSQKPTAAPIRTALPAKKAPMARPRRGIFTRMARAAAIVLSVLAGTSGAVSNMRPRPTPGMASASTGATGPSSEAPQISFDLPPAHVATPEASEDLSVNFTPAVPTTQGRRSPGLIRRFLGKSWHREVGRGAATDPEIVTGYYEQFAQRHLGVDPEVALQDPKQFGLVSKEQLEGKDLPGVRIVSNGKNAHEFLSARLADYFRTVVGVRGTQNVWREVSPILARLSKSAECGTIDQLPSSSVLSIHNGRVTVFSGDKIIAETPLR